MTPELALDELRREVADLRRRLARIEAEERDDDGILNMREVIAFTTLSRREIGRRVKHNLFPKPISLGAKRRGWRKSAIQRWLRNQQKVQRAS